MTKELAIIVVAECNDDSNVVFCPGFSQMMYRLIQLSKVVMITTKSNIMKVTLAKL